MTLMCLGGAFPKPEYIEGVKAGIIKWLAADTIPPMECITHTIVASADTRHAIATAGDDCTKRLQGWVVSIILANKVK